MSVSPHHSGRSHHASPSSLPRAPFPLRPHLPLNAAVILLDNPPSPPPASRSSCHSYPPCPDPSQPLRPSLPPLQQQYSGLVSPRRSKSPSSASTLSSISCESEVRSDPGTRRFKTCTSLSPEEYLSQQRLSASLKFLQPALGNLSRHVLQGASLLQPAVSSDFLNSSPPTTPVGSPPSFRNKRPKNGHPHPPHTKLRLPTPGGRDPQPCSQPCSLSKPSLKIKIRLKAKLPKARASQRAILQSARLLSSEECRDADGKLLRGLCSAPQSKSCNSLPSALRAYRCGPCIGKVAGYVCAFRSIRNWIVRWDAGHIIVGGPEFPLVNTSECQLTYRNPSFPKSFTHSPLQDLSELRCLLAQVLLPALDREVEWLSSAKVHFIGRRLDLVTKCDYCSATLIGAAWLCTQCGAEACLRCYNVMQEQQTLHLPPGGTSERPKCEWLKRLTTCTKCWDSAHSPSTHIRISHITIKELESLRQQMLDVLSNTPLADMKRPSAFELPEVHSVPSDLLHYLHQPEDCLSEPYIKISVDELEAHPQIFNRLWAAGQAIVVTGMKDRFRLPWDPQYFIENYGQDDCNMLDSNQMHQDPQNISVSEFFQRFHSEPAEGEPVWKLRDWPPEVDFEEKFKDLFTDFQNGIPIQHVTARKGILNVAAHFPIDANTPDLGPKMYIAMKNNDELNLKKSAFHGSTVLHMDVADAINVQTYAGGDPDGYALWHLYHAKHTEPLRAFLYQYRADAYQISLEESKTKFDDPIHTARIYVNSEMRKVLREQYGVVGWEIKQKPGEAVFIPAYTAHQVCNMANCIKVAADFVSPQSIRRCLLLTEEFRLQNHESRKPWREDILQINQMLLYAFCSLGELLQESKEKDDKVVQDWTKSKEQEVGGSKQTAEDVRCSIDLGV